jgi:hypothetical protein
VPYPHTSHKSNLAGIAAVLPYEVGGPKKTPVKRNSHVRCELTLDFVTEAESYLDVIQASARRESFDSLDSAVDFEAWLNDQPLS